MPFQMKNPFASLALMMQNAKNSLTKKEVPFKHVQTIDEDTQVVVSCVLDVDFNTNQAKAKKNDCDVKIVQRHPAQHIQHINPNLPSDADDDEDDDDNKN
jgi:hypothetical protein